MDEAKNDSSKMILQRTSKYFLWPWSNVYFLSCIINAFEYYWTLNKKILFFNFWVAVQKLLTIFSWTELKSWRLGLLNKYQKNKFNILDKYQKTNFLWSWRFIGAFLLGTSEAKLDFSKLSEILSFPYMCSMRSIMVYFNKDLG